MKQDSRFAAPRRNHTQEIYEATSWVKRVIGVYQASQVAQAVLWLRALPLRVAKLWSKVDQRAHLNRNLQL